MLARWAAEPHTADEMSMLHAERDIPVTLNGRSPAVWPPPRVEGADLTYAGYVPLCARGTRAGWVPLL